MPMMANDEPANAGPQPSQSDKIRQLRPVELLPPGPDETGGSDGGSASGDLVLLIDPKAPLEIARLFVRVCFAHEGWRTIHHWRGDWWTWKSGQWIRGDQQNIRNQIYRFVERCRKSVGSDGKTAKCPPNARFVGNVEDALRSVAEVPSALAPPCWLPPHVAALDGDPADNEDTP